MIKLEINDFLKILKKCKPYISKQQIKTLKGQAIKGNIEGAKKGLFKIMKQVWVTYIERWLNVKDKNRV